MFQLNLKRVLPIVAVTLVLASCSGPKVATVTHADMQGNWILNNITYDGLGSGDNVKMTLLDEGSDACLIGSAWNLPFNGYGSYTLSSTAAGCPTGMRKIVWSYQKSGDQPYFQFKRLEEGVKAKNVQDGYRFKVVEVTKTSMSLQSEVAFEGKSVFINYSFAKQ